MEEKKNPGFRANSRKYYNEIYDGKRKNDYTNSFLNHFGFPAPEMESSDGRDRRKYMKMPISLRRGGSDYE
jgi:hypothetical protein